ncbi:GNAT family N-acetyltransferase [Bdellovibrio sp. HCB185ZH]|uniref:GNAT family N-acetyltransferase n=1 Tax=Bdellovibrio sp. HCB185ZH TaxID=3394235 RepID=UPI0039A6827F
MSKFSTTIYKPEYHQAFVELNKEWIEHYFRLETMDLLQLNQAKESILNTGGEIFFILDGASAIATCAMVPHGKNSYELAKMAVSPKYKGQGLGDLLMETAIAWARHKGATEITLLSNTILEPAISLYKKHGFQTVHLGAHPDYERCNIEMKLSLE